MLTKLQLSIKILQEATAKFLENLQKIKKEENKLIKEINTEKDQRKIEELKNKLGI